MVVIIVKLNYRNLYGPGRHVTQTTLTANFYGRASFQIDNWAHSEIGGQDLPLPRVATASR